MTNDIKITPAQSIYKYNKKREIPLKDMIISVHHASIDHIKSNDKSEKIQAWERLRAYVQLTKDADGWDYECHCPIDYICHE
jgi:hypothetical protein